MEKISSKALILGSFHKKNTDGLYKILSFLKIEFKHLPDLSDFSIFTDYDIIISPCKPIDASKWPSKKFIFGPHFGVYPSVLPMINCINNCASNSVYVQPSNWVCDLFSPVVKSMPVKTLSFPVDTERFTDCRVNPLTSNKVMIYFKNRNPSCLTFMRDFLSKKGFEIVLFDYAKRYNENDYIQALRNVEFVCWIGSHESQGFGFQEALSMNVPLFVWNVKFLSDEWGGNRPQITATTLSYWDDSCGAFFDDIKNMESCFELFYANLKKGLFQPRDFIQSCIGTDACAARFLKLFT
jgi:hypothetical protein